MSIEVFRCEECNLKSSSRHKLRDLHIRLRLTNCPKGMTRLQLKKLEFPKCHLCPEPNILQHQNWHHGEQKHKCPEDGCEYRSDKLDRGLDSITHHRFIYHGTKLEKQKFPCDKCPSVLTRRSHLERHQLLHHSPELPFGCDICQFRGLSKGTIKAHKGNYHETRNYKCQLGCGKTFTTKKFSEIHSLRWCPLSKQKTELTNTEVETGTGQ